MPKVREDLDALWKSLPDKVAVFTFYKPEYIYSNFHVHEPFTSTVPENLKREWAPEEVEGIEFSEKLIMLSKALLFDD